MNSFLPALCQREHINGDGAALSRPKRLGESSAECVNRAEGLSEAVRLYSERRGLRRAKRLKPEIRLRISTTDIKRNFVKLAYEKVSKHSRLRFAVGAALSRPQQIRRR